MSHRAITTRLVFDPQALIDFHRRTFGGYTMMADDSGDGGDADSGDNQAGDTSGDQGDTKTSDKDDLGFPANTRVVDMTADQKAAYWQHQSRKHEERATEYRTAAGGKSAAEIKADLELAEAAKRDKLTPSEQALEDAKREAREATAREFGTKSVRTAFELALRNLPEQDRKDLIDDLDLTRFLTDSGDVDTAKVLTRAEKIAPADKDKGTRRLDFGGGSRGSTKAEAGVAAGAAMYAARKNPTTT